MGYDLTNSAGGYVRFNGSGWDLVLAVSRHYGWEPAGIAKPDSWDETRDGAWEDGYWMNAGQQVTPEDAAALTQALRRALASPDLIETIIRIKAELDGTMVESHPRMASRIAPLTRNDAEQFRLRLVEFADFTAQGPFAIS